MSELLDGDVMFFIFTVFVPPSSNFFHLPVKLHYNYWKAAIDTRINAVGE